MFALGVEFLMGRAAMTRWDSRREGAGSAEWPPHPDRVFMALVAAFGESGEHDLERDALLWLEAQGPPALSVPDATAERAVVTSYVPVNGDRAKDTINVRAAPMGTMPIGLVRQARVFPTVVPDDPTFHLVWHGVDLPADLRPAVDRLCRHVTCLGHSASPVRVWIDDAPPPPTLVPTEGRAVVSLRAFGPGRLDDLRARYAVGVRPQPTRWQGYARPSSPLEAEVAGAFDPGLIVLRQVGGRRFGLESAGMIAESLRDELMRRHGPGAPEWLTGHTPDGTPSRQPRPAIVPLGFVNREHADGHLLGVAIALPAGFDPEAAGHLAELLERHGEPDEVAADGVGYARLTVHNPVLARSAGSIELELDERPTARRPYTLRPWPWTRPARVWATVTPIVLPRFPRRGLSAEEVVAAACVEAGYPEPAGVRVSFAPLVRGVPHSRSFFVRPRTGRPPRPLTHAEILFPDPVTGPVLVGAGRYAGFGLCRPLREDAE